MPFALSGSSHKHFREPDAKPCYENEAWSKSYAASALSEIRAKLPHAEKIRAALEVDSVSPPPPVPQREERVGNAELLLMPDGSREMLTGATFTGAVQLCGLSTAARTPRKIDALKTTGELPPEVVRESKKADKETIEAEARARKAAHVHKERMIEADAKWKKFADQGDFTQVRAHLSVYKYSGEDLKTDPRRTDEYRDKVVEELGFGKDCKRTDMTKEDSQAVAAVLREKAAAFWLEKTPRTVLLHLKHDTVPTGAPVRTPPHHLKGEEAQWVDDQLQAEVETGQLERGHSEWASPPFATKELSLIHI